MSRWQGPIFRGLTVAAAITMTFLSSNAYFHDPTQQSFIELFVASLSLVGLVGLWFESMSKALRGGQASGGATAETTEGFKRSISELEKIVVARIAEAMKTLRELEEQSRQLDGVRELGEKAAEAEALVQKKARELEAREKQARAAHAPPQPR